VLVASSSLFLDEQIWREYDAPLMACACYQMHPFRKWYFGKRYTKQYNLDAVHFSIRHGDKADSTIILTALVVDLEGNKEVLAYRACAVEGKDGWVSVLQDLRARGATQIDSLVTQLSR